MTNYSPDFSLPQLEERITPRLAEVEEQLLESVKGSRDLIDDLTAHLAEAGGKRIRPLLTMLCAELGSDPLNADVTHAAVAVELTHLATLYHDDVMDSAPQRRGVRSAQLEWGNNRAILAGDVLFARASRLVAALGPKSVASHAATFERLCIGQLNETFGPEADQDPVEFYLQVLADKTGSLVAAAASFGAMHGQAREDIRLCVEKYGEKIGVAFQIADDILDLVSPGDISGKTPGTDLREGVDTLPILLLRRRPLDVLDNAGKQILTALEGDLSNDANLTALVQAIAAHDVIAETRELAQKWAHDAIVCLDPLPEGDPKLALVKFADLLVQRLA